MIAKPVTILYKRPDIKFDWYGLAYGSICKLDQVRSTPIDMGIVFVPMHLPDYTRIVHEPIVRAAPVRHYIASLGFELTVRFDGCNHPSGRQRAYIACPRTAHTVHGFPSCRRYVFVHNFRTVKEAVCWLLAWALLEPVPTDQAKHVGKNPTDRQIQVYRDGIESI